MVMKFFGNQISKCQSLIEISTSIIGYRLKPSLSNKQFLNYSFIRSPCRYTSHTSYTCFIVKHHVCLNHRHTYHMIEYSCIRNNRYRYNYSEWTKHKDAAYVFFLRMFSLKGISPCLAQWKYTLSFYNCSARITPLQSVGSFRIFVDNAFQSQ